MLPRYTKLSACSTVLPSTVVCKGSQFILSTHPDKMLSAVLDMGPVALTQYYNLISFFYIFSTLFSIFNVV